MIRLKNSLILILLLFFFREGAAQEFFQVNRINLSRPGNYMEIELRGSVTPYYGLFISGNKSYSTPYYSPYKRDMLRYSNKYINTNNCNSNNKSTGSGMNDDILGNWKQVFIYD